VVAVAGDDIGGAGNTGRRFVFRRAEPYEHTAIVGRSLPLPLTLVPMRLPSNHVARSPIPVKVQPEARIAGDDVGGHLRQCPRSCWPWRPIVRRKPSRKLPTPAVPVLSVPMRFPSTRLPDVPLPYTLTPYLPLPEITLVSPESRATQRVCSGATPDDDTVPGVSEFGTSAGVVPMRSLQ